MCVTVSDWETIGELTLYNFEKNYKNINKNTSGESKSIHCTMKPIQIQLECPFNSRNKKYPCMNIYVLIFIAQAMYFTVYQHMCERTQAQMCC